MTVIKGKALRQDFKHYDGINPNGSRKDSTGGFFQGLAVGDEVDLLMVYGSGNERNNQTIQNAVTAIGSRKATLKFAPGTWTISSNVTVPGNLAASIPAGVTFDIDSGITLTFSGPVRADSENIKTGSGTLTYTDERMLQSVAGTNTITASSLSTTTALRNGQEFFIIPANTITAAATLNINSTGAVNLRKNQSGGVVALVANDLIANNLYRCTYVSAGPYFIVHALSSYAQGADIASATTINLDTATGDYVHVTGTTTITGVTLKQGQERTIVFDGILTFTHGASLILPVVSNITTAAGDTAILRGEASGVVRCIQYTSATHGSYTGTATGLTTSPTGTIYYRVVGNMVFLEHKTGISGTSNATTFTITGAPAGIRPAVSSGLFCMMVRDNGTWQIGVGQMGSSGTLILDKGDLSAWTNSGTKAISQFTAHYMLSTP
jgi:hypothetical protein